MADLLNFTITPKSAVQVNVPRATIGGKWVDSNNQSIVLADLTGANAVEWPGVLTALTPEQRQQLIELVAQELLRMRAGVEL